MNEFNVVAEQFIQVPVEKAFQAVVDPAHMSRYFISSGSGMMESNKTLIWEWKDYNAKAEIKVLEVIENQKVIFEWSAMPEKPTRVEMEFAAVITGTNIKVTESAFSMTDEEVQAALGQKQGWTDMLLCLKAYLLYSINLRSNKPHKI